MLLLLKYKLVVPDTKFLRLSETSPFKAEAFKICDGPDEVMFPKTDKLVQVIPKLTFKALLNVVLPDTNKFPIEFKLVPIVSEPDINNDVPDIELAAKLPDTFNVDKTVSAPDTNNEVHDIERDTELPDTFKLDNIVEPPLLKFAKLIELLS